jgi:hypothetical protein
VEQDAKAAAAGAAAAPAEAAPSSPATTRAASQLAPSESPRAARARVLAANRARVYCERVQEARAKAFADAREMTVTGGTSTFDYKANGQLRASKGAGYVAKAARVSGIVNAINAATTSLQRVEALHAALAQTDVRATTLRAGAVMTLETGSMVVDAYFYNSVPRAWNWWMPAPSLTLVVPSWWSTSASISSRRVRWRVTIGPAYRARATCGRQRQPAQCTCMMRCAHSDRRGVSRARSRARQRCLQVVFDVGHTGPSGQGVGSDSE